MANPETILNMNESNGKYAHWIVRVLDPRVVVYSFQARGVQVTAKKFVCVLVSKNPSEYALGIVPFDFKAPNTAEEALKKFLPGTVWEVKKPAFDTRSKPAYVGAPLKRVLLLQKPTALRAIPPTEAATRSFPAAFALPKLTLSNIVGVKNIQHDAGRTVDMTAKVVSMAPPKKTVLKGVATAIQEIELVDDSTLPSGKRAKCLLSVWGKAIDLFENIGISQGVTLMGVSVVLTDDQIKLHMHEGNGYVMTEGERVKALSDMDTDGTSFDSVTHEWVPTGKPVDVSGDAIYTCACRMKCLTARDCSTADDLVFQLNRALLDFPTDESQLYTQDKCRLYVRGVVRDWTGPVDVEVIQSAVPALYGLSTRDEVESALAAGSLTTCQYRVNIRGVRRVESGVVKYLVGDIVKCSNTELISMSACRDLLGLCDLLGDIVVPAPLKCITMCPLVGLAVIRRGTQNIAAHRILALVEGTTASKLKKIGSVGGEDAYLVESPNVKCLLSDWGRRCGKLARLLWVRGDAPIPIG